MAHPYKSGVGRLPARGDAVSIQAEIVALQEQFRLDSVALDELLRGPNGPVAADLAARAIRVESAAKVNASQPPRAGPNSGSEPGQGPAVRTGRLRGSITWRLGVDELGLYADVGSNVEYAIFVETGTSRMAARPYLVPSLIAAQG